jgi:hypothetical protein
MEEEGSARKSSCIVSQLRQFRLLKIVGGKWLAMKAAAAAAAAAAQLKIPIQWCCLPPPSPFDVGCWA